MSISSETFQKIKDENDVERQNLSQYRAKPFHHSQMQGKIDNTDFDFEFTSHLTLMKGNQPLHHSCAPWTSIGRMVAASGAFNMPST